MDTKATERGAGASKAPRRRRTYSIALKREMVEATLSGSESVSVVARRYDVNANQLFRWRRLYRQGKLEDNTQIPRLLPVSVQTPQPAIPPTSSAPLVATPSETGQIEIHLSHGAHLVITGTPCGQTLRTVLEALSG